MKITRISVYRALLPIPGGYTFAKGKAVTVADTTITRIDTDTGVVVNFRDPNYCPDSGGFHPVEIAIGPDGGTPTSQ